MDDKIIAAIMVKNLGVDENGFQQYLWATKKQAQRLLEAQFDEERNHFVYMLGDESIRPCDMLRVRFVKVKEAKEWVAFRKYVLIALEQEVQEEKRLTGTVNEDKISKLDKMKKRINKHLL